MIVPIAPYLAFTKGMGGAVGLGCAGAAQDDKVDAGNVSVLHVDPTKVH